MADDLSPRVLITRRLPPRVEARLAAPFRVELAPDDQPVGHAALVAAMGQFDALLVTITDRIDAEVLSAPAARVRILANFGAGLDHIDLAAARGAGLIVTNTPDEVTEATADLALLLMLMATRRAGEGERELRAGRWSGWRPTHLVGQGLSGKVLGLVGFGRIARATALRARALGMTIAYHSRTRATAEDEQRFAARWVGSLDALAAEADLLSLHTPGGAETRRLVDARLIGLMKPTAVLINTARGPVVDEADLAAALAEGRLAAAGLDVYEQEPRIHPALLALENVVLLPHLGSNTIETRAAMGLRAAANLEAFFAGREPPDRVA